MNTSRYANWRADLDASRDLNDLEKQNYGFVLAKPRKDWQRERWGGLGLIGE